MTIGYLKNKGYSVREIASALSRSVSTVSEELRRNIVRGRYDPAKANRKAYVRRKYAKYQGMKIVAHSPLRKEIVLRLYDDQSPEAIAGVIRRRRVLPSISKNAIYRWIGSVYGRAIEAYRRKRRTRRMRKRAKTASLGRRTFIDERPKKINERKGVGHAEADFIVSGKGGRGILLVVVCRKSRVAFLERITSVSIQNVHAAFLKIKRRFPELQTLTMDNDILFQRHEELARLLNVKVYFCRPYHSWEKGTVENANKVIRRDVPKGSDISRYSRRFIESLEWKLNRRPMKCLGYWSPRELLDAYRRRRYEKSP